MKTTKNVSIKTIFEEQWKRTKCNKEIKSEIQLKNDPTDLATKNSHTSTTFSKSISFAMKSIEEYLHISILEPNPYFQITTYFNCFFILKYSLFSKKLLKWIPPIFENGKSLNIYSSIFLSLFGSLLIFLLL